MAAAGSVCPFLPAGMPAPLAFGIAAIDGRLPGRGLDPHGLHELKPLGARDAGPTLTLALALAGRRVSLHRPLLLVLGGRASTEHGLPYGPGLGALGLDPARLLIVTAARTADALWALEEGLRARALGCVLGLLETVGGMSARRLVLAAGEGATPCLLLTAPGKEGIGVAHTRWRAGSLASAPHPFDAAAPGAARCQLTLERCRAGPSDLAWTLEWCHASHRFGLAAPVRARALEAHAAGRGAR